MGHLMFAGFFCLLIVLVFLRLWLGYLLAKRSKPNGDAVPIKIPNEGRSFKAKRYVGFVFLLLIPTYLAGSIYIGVQLWHKDTPDATVIFWLAVDLIVPVTLLFLACAIKGFQSYIAIDKEGFEYRDVFRVKRYYQENIEGVYCDNEFIYIKCRNKRIPVIIENLYGDRDLIFRMLCTVKDGSNGKSNN